MKSLSLAGLLVIAALAGCGSDSPESDPAGGSVYTYGPLTPENAPKQKTEAEAEPPARAEPKEPSVARPPITQRRIPFPAERQAQMAEYSQRHYGEAESALSDPQVIVEHFTVTPTADGVYDIFASNKPDVELKERPQVCSHFLIDRDGTILQLVPLRLRCRHTVGLNHTAIGIEHVGASDAEVLGNRAQMRSSLKLTRWLACRHGIEEKDVIGHNESLSSPYHEERVARLRTQTHDDFGRASMDRYRHRLPACAN